MGKRKPSFVKRVLSVLAEVRPLEIELPSESKDSWAAAAVGHKLKSPSLCPAFKAMVTMEVVA